VVSPGWVNPITQLLAHTRYHHAVHNRISIPDVAKGIKRRFFRRTKRQQQEGDRRRAESQGMATGSGTGVIALALAIPSVATFVAVLLGMGYWSLLAIPVFWLAFWWFRRASARDRAPLIATWRARRRRRRSLRKAKANEKAARVDRH